MDKVKGKGRGRERMWVRKKGSWNSKRGRGEMGGIMRRNERKEDKEGKE